MFLVPLNSLVLFKNGSNSYETFAQKASYLFNKSMNDVWYNGAIRTIRYTKNALGDYVYSFTNTMENLLQNILKTDAILAGFVK
jgi:L-2,4-diaminobutyrate decarboxylase